MKTLLALAAVLCLVPAAARACPGCNDEKAQHTHAKAGPANAPQAEKPAAPLAADQARVTIPVAGMHCDHCISRVTTALTKVDGVKSVDASLEKGQAVVAFEKGKVDASKLVETINALGFEAGAPVPN